MVTVSRGGRLPGICTNLHMYSRVVTGRTRRPPVMPPVITGGMNTRHFIFCKLGFVKERCAATCVCTLYASDFFVHHSFLNFSVRQVLVWKLNTLLCMRPLERSLFCSPTYIKYPQADALLLLYIIFGEEWLSNLIQHFLCSGLSGCGVHHLVDCEERSQVPTFQIWWAVHQWDVRPQYLHIWNTTTVNLKKGSHPHSRWPSSLSSLEAWTPDIPPSV